MPWSGRSCCACWKIPSVIQEELNRRLEAARHADPLKQREEFLRRDHARLEKSMDRLLNAYQEGLVSLDQLRSSDAGTAPKATSASGRTAVAASGHRRRCPVPAAGGNARRFLCPVTAEGGSLEVTERQKILRLLVKEILVGRDTLTIRHSIRIANAGPDPSGITRPPHAPQQPPTPQPAPRYLLRSSRHQSAAVQYLSRSSGSLLG